MVTPPRLEADSLTVVLPVAALRPVVYTSFRPTSASSPSTGAQRGSPSRFSASGESSDLTRARACLRLGSDSGTG